MTSPPGPGTCGLPCLRAMRRTAGPPGIGVLAGLPASSRPRLPPGFWGL
jgi:hypothetical protein